MRLAVLNTFYPPDNAITGQSAAVFVDFLKQQHPEFAIRVYAGAGSYIQGSDKCDQPQSVIRLGSSGRHKSKFRRLAQSLILGRQMARQAVGWADVILSQTDPPLLGFWLAWYRLFSRRPVAWIEWTMDLFPEAFTAAGIISRRNLIYRALAKFLSRHPADAYVCLGEAQATAVRRLRSASSPIVVLPCGIVTSAIQTAEIPPWRKNENRIVLAYAGNLGLAHCPELLPALLQVADPGKFAFVFALQGEQASKVRARLQEHTNIFWTNHLSHSDLSFADVAIVSLRAQYTDVCVPSKAVSSICLGRPILFAGEPDSDTALMFGDAIWRVPIPPDGRYDESQLLDVLSQITDPAQRISKKRRAREIGADLHEMQSGAFRNLATLITELHNRHASPERRIDIGSPPLTTEHNLSPT